MTPVHPLSEQPCLHRVLAECPNHDQVIRLAGLYGLLTATGKVARADTLPLEPVNTWCRQIRELRSATALWDAIRGKDEAALRRMLPPHQAAKGKELLDLARERLARPVTERISGGRAELIAPDGDQPFTIRIRPVKLIDAIWQQFAAEIAGLIACTRCPAPGCDRWFPRSHGPQRSRVLLPCLQMRAWRGVPI